MTTEARIQLNSSEISALWQTYLFKSAKILLADVIKDKIIDKKAQSIFTDAITGAQNMKNEIVNIFNNENLVIPLGFNESDIVREAPPLFDDIFNIMYLRQMQKLNFGYFAVFTPMSYTKEVIDIMKLGFDTSTQCYSMTTSYLLEKGVLARTPYVTTPKQVKLIENKNYMSGLNIFSPKRALNIDEVAYIYDGLENHIFNMKLLMGFAQIVKENEIKKYFIDGKELAKKNITILSDLLLQSDIQPPSTWAGNITDSTQSPFSDKLMMYLNSLIAMTSLGFTGLGTSFSMRSDLPLKLALISKDVFEYSKEGAKLMIKYKWMEEPPKM